MKKNFSFNNLLLTFFFSLLLLFSFACKTAKKTKKVYKYKCNIESTSQSFADFLIDSNSNWISNKPANNDLIIISFDSSRYIHYLKIEQDARNENKITKVKVYSDKGILGNFSPDSITINKYISKLFIKIESTTNFNLTKFYNKNDKYSVAFGNNNKYVAIKKIHFFYDNSTEIRLIADKVQNANALETKKLVDYSKEKLTVIRRGKFIYINQEAKTDTFWYGKIKGNKAYLKKVFFNSDTIIKQNDTLIYNSDKFKITVEDKIIFKDFPDYFFVDVQSLDSTIKKDIKYATTDNFMRQKVYPCGKCLLRYQIAKKLSEAQKEFRQKGYSIKVFDCYRPLPVQYKMWKIMPNKNYVANPNKGSMHNRGLAVDMTIVDSTGKEVDMGTKFDFFGHKAYSIDTNIAPKVLANRRFMWNIMHKYGFWEIKTEWWHLSFRTNFYPIDSLPLPCD